MCRARSYVWLNQFADQFVPILALLALRVVVGVGDAVLKRFSKPKKGAMQARLPQLSHAQRVPVDFSSCMGLCKQHVLPKAEDMLRC